MPKGLAHGFLTLENDTEILCQMSEFYWPESARGIRYDNPYFGVQWPIEIQVISLKNRNWQYFSP